MYIFSGFFRTSIELRQTRYVRTVYSIYFLSIDAIQKTHFITGGAGKERLNIVVWDFPWWQTVNDNMVLTKRTSKSPDSLATEQDLEIRPLFCSSIFTANTEWDFTTSIHSKAKKLLCQLKHRYSLASRQMSRSLTKSISHKSFISMSSHINVRFPPSDSSPYHERRQDRVFERYSNMVNAVN